MYGGFCIEGFVKKCVVIFRDELLNFVVIKLILGCTILHVEEYNIGKFNECGLEQKTNIIVERFQNLGFPEIYGQDFVFPVDQSEHTIILEKVKLLLEKDPLQFIQNKQLGNSTDGIGTRLPRSEDYQDFFGIFRN